MKLKTLIILKMIFNIACFVAMLILIIKTVYEIKSLEYFLSSTLGRTGIVLVVQASGNLLLKSIPISTPTFLMPIPPKEDKDVREDK